MHHPRNPRNPFKSTSQSSQILCPFLRPPSPSCRTCSPCLCSPRPSPQRWDRDGYSVTYGTLSSFLSDYCRMGMIKLDPEPENGDPVLILGNPEGPDASMLQSGWHIRRTSPDSELIKLQIKIAIKYIFWLMMPVCDFKPQRGMVMARSSARGHGGWWRI